LHKQWQMLQCTLAKPVQGTKKYINNKGREYENTRRRKKGFPWGNRWQKGTINIPCSALF